MIDLNYRIPQCWQVLRSSLHWWAFAALCSLFLGTTALWLRLDHSPPAWDDAFYLSHSLRLYDALTAGGLPAYARQFLTGMRDKPPLIAALPTPVYLLFGRNPHLALTVNLASLMATFAALYLAGRKFAGARAGVLAVFIVGTMPMIYGLSHWYLVECGLTAIVSLVICLAAEWQNDLRTAFLLGVLCSLGMLMKLSFPLYVVAPLTVLLWTQRRAPPPLKMLAAAALPAATVAAPWYLVNLPRALYTALRAGSGETAHIYRTGEILSLPEIARYLGDILNCGPAIYFAFLVLLVPACFPALPAPARRGLLLCALWASPLLFLAFGHYRDLRYAAPLFPAAALALGILLDASIARYGVAARAVACLTLGLGAASMLHTSFGILGNRPLVLRGLLFSQPRFNYASRVQPAPWPHREILQDLYDSAQWTGGERKRLVIGNDAPHLNADNLALAALAARLPFEIATTAYKTTAARLQHTLASASYFLYRDGGELDSPFNTLGSEAAAMVRADPNFTEMASRTFPDGGTVHLFANASRDRSRLIGAYLPPGLDRLHDCSVTFDGKLELTGLSMRQTEHGTEVQYRWRCLKPVARNYWCFTHILDQHGNAVGFLDHPLINADPPTSQWAAGSVAIERLQLLLPASRQSGAYRLRLGLFQKESGERAPITSSSFPLTDSGTAAVASVDRPPMSTDTSTLQSKLR